VIRIQLHRLGKFYRLYRRPFDRLKDLLFGTRSYQPQWALRDVGLTVKEGESIGVIGNNGAGKSTLLKLVSGVLQSTSGTVAVNGRLTAILELGTGFHPDFTGRENIFSSGELLGISRAELNARYDEIVAFSGLKEYIDKPIKTYSTGMTMRLGFALVTSVNPDILIVDEALAVGDRQFQQKCIKRMKAIKESGTSILFCSHSMHHITQFCERAMWLEHGKVKALGDAKSVVERYVASSAPEQTGVADKREKSYAPDKAPARTERCSVRDVTSLAPGSSLLRGEKLKVRIDFTIHEPDDYVFGVAIDRENTGQRLVAETSVECGYPPVALEADDYQVVFSIDTESFREGNYLIKAGLLDKSLLKIEDYRILEIQIRDRDDIRSPSLIRVPVNWDLNNEFGLGARD